MKLSRRRMFALLAAASAAGTGTFAARAAAAARYYDGPVSDHFDGVRFFDPDGVPPKSFREFVRWWATSNKSEWPLAYHSGGTGSPADCLR